MCDILWFTYIWSNYSQSNYVESFYFLANDQVGSEKNGRYDECDKTNVKITDSQYTEA